MQSIIDAPLVFYEEDKIVVRSLVSRYKKQVPHAAVYSLQQRNRIIVHCTFPEHPEWNFSTHLHPSLIITPAVYPPAERILALSDIEGSFEAFRDLLLTQGVIDAQYNWTFGKGRLVLNGDCVDRGPYAMQCLWLLYALEEKARRQGGYVHFILGNHEIMNMSGDLRYVNDKYFEQARVLQQDYLTWFQPDTELGRWLATKNIMEKIGPLLFVHGGIAPAINTLPVELSAINRLCRPWYFTPIEAFPIQFFALYDLLYSSDAPFWYRGYVLGHATRQDIDKTLQQFDVSRILIGHTTVEKVTALFEGKVIAMDTPHADGFSEAVLVEGERVYRVNKDQLKEEI